MPLKVTLFLMLFAVDAFAQTPKVSSGAIQHIANFPSKYVPARNVDVWLPDGYSPLKNYAVVYMQDGMALFDAGIMWNKQEWGVDETMGRLIADGKIKDCIVVGIWNGNANRHSEYFPQKPFEMLTARQQDSLYSIPAGNGKLFAEKIQSENYLKFMVHELKPYIDSHYATFTDATNTYVMGSSMGGLISLYAICEYPKVFGGAACLSTHWPGLFTVNNNPVPAAFMAYLRKYLPSPKNHKIYFDHGDATLDAMYQPYQQQVDEIMKKKGFSANNWLSKEFPGADHSENSWRKRLDEPMVFLLKN
ncbi:alpha/beta hydrolase [Mucilaginibacter boryungensis]|uniref:Esterase family protein n=1 Tax=Mucilaginibacter boryungensis TaxID=768480 RepID=A0ABR9XDR3_9SPHI|nr:alpha/beta hydrolase-fold protein [Mucilaginibacter boryungensis]MBE9665317.1 esterase family protein [Mucilaginibacter boryungensis]